MRGVSERPLNIRLVCWGHIRCSSRGVIILSDIGHGPDIPTVEIYTLRLHKPTEGLMFFPPLAGAWSSPTTCPTGSGSTSTKHGSHRTSPGRISAPVFALASSSERKRPRSCCTKPSPTLKWMRSCPTATPAASATSSLKAKSGTKTARIPRAPSFGWTRSPPTRPRRVARRLFSCFGLKVSKLLEAVRFELKLRQQVQRHPCSSPLHPTAQAGPKGQLA